MVRKLFIREKSSGADWFFSFVTAPCYTWSSAGSSPFSVAFLYIYINDLPSIISTCQLKSYVDDSKLLLSFLARDENIALGKIKQNLFDVSRWCCEHKLLINRGKTKFLMTGTRQLQRSAAIELTISFLGEDLLASAFASDLGVILDSTLSYDEHITKLISTCMSKLCQINRVKDCFNKDIFKLITESLLLSQLYY